MIITLPGITITLRGRRTEKSLIVHEHKINKKRTFHSAQRIRGTLGTEKLVPVGTDYKLTLLPIQHYFFFSYFLSFFMRHSTLKSFCPYPHLTFTLFCVYIFFLSLPVIFLLSALRIIIYSRYFLVVITYSNIIFLYFLLSLPFFLKNPFVMRI